MIGGMGAGLKGRAPQWVDNPPLSDTGSGLAVHVGFSTTGGWLSRGIRRVTRSRVSHCIVVYRCEMFGQEMVLEASGSGFRLISWRRWDRVNRLIALYRLNLPEESVRPALRQLADRLGDSYDTVSLLGFVLRGLFRLKRVPFDSRKRLVCSEALALFLSWCGLPLRDIGTLTPRDMLHLAEERKETFTLVEASTAFPYLARRIERRARRMRRQMQPTSEPPLVG